MSYAIRCQIFAFLQIGFTVPMISHATGFHKSTIYREIKRNGPQVYRPLEAQKKSEQRGKTRRRPLIVEGKHFDLIIFWLMSGMSPEQISGRLKLEKGIYVSHQTIHTFVKRRREFRRYLPIVSKRGFSRYKKTKITSRHGLPISMRPEVINSRSRIGDWERDGMYGANKKQLLVCTERKTKFTLFELMPSTNSSVVAALTKKILRRSKKPYLSVTNDRGTEFRGCQKMGVPVYYCDALKPQQRGTIENTIGMLRKKISSKTDLEALGPDGIRALEREFNMLPRKCLGFKTPFEVFYGTKVALAI